MGVRSASITTYERDIFMVSLFFCAFLFLSLPHSSHLISIISTTNLLSPSLPIYLYPPIYICSIFHTILCKYLGHLSPLSIYLSCLIYLSYLSTYLISNIYYIYNKYPIYLSLPYNLYTHDHICSIFIIDYVIISNLSISYIYISISSPYPLVWIGLLID